MSSSAAGYDTTSAQFCPEGRIFQVEYARKATSNSGTALGLRGKDGVVFAVENLATSKLYEVGTNIRSYTVDKHVGVVGAGFVPDLRQIVELAKTEAVTYRSEHNEAVPLNYLKDRVAMYMHVYTLYSGIRPFGASVIMGTYENNNPKMYCIYPCGKSLGYYGVAVGKGIQTAKTEMEKLELKDMTCEQLVKEAARIIYIVNAEGLEEDFKLELSWVGKNTKGQHTFVPYKVFKEAQNYAKIALEEYLL